MIYVGYLCSKKNNDTSDFYLGGRKLGPLVTAMSAEASDMSSWLLMGPVSYTHLDVYKRQPYYRALETLALKQLIQDSERKVISLGAGLPLQEQNEKYLRELGTVVYLKGSLATLKKRLEGSKKDPMLDGEDRDDKIKKLLKQRDPVYQKFADIQVTTGEVPFEELIKEIEEKLASYEKK